MEAKSTIDITREEAVDFILSVLAMMNNTSLAFVLEDVIGLHNFRIVSEES